MAIKTYTNDEFLREIPIELGHVFGIAQRGETPAAVVERVRGEMPKWARDNFVLFAASAMDPKFLGFVNMAEGASSLQRVLLDAARSRMFWLEVARWGRESLEIAVSDVLINPEQFSNCMVRDAELIRAYRDTSYARKDSQLHWFIFDARAR
jgi:hypothetical protein